MNCADVDECQLGTDNCAANAVCSNTVGGFDCNCNPGYSGDGVDCVDIDECALGLDDCSPNAICANTMGRFRCTCNDGYAGDGVNCNDIDECRPNSIIAPPMQPVSTV